MLKKKLYALIFIFIVSAGSYVTRAQEFFVSVNGGYAVGTAKGNFYTWAPFSFINGGALLQIPLQNVTEDASGMDITQERIKISYGEGAAFGLNVGYMFSKHLGVGLDFSYAMSRKQKATINAPTIQGVISETISKSSVFSITPSFIITGNSEKIHPYAKAGLFLGLPSIQTTVNADDNGNILNYEEKAYKGIAVGASVSVGVNYPVSDKVRLFGELCYKNVNYSPRRLKVETLTVNGVDDIPNTFPNGTELEMEKNSITIQEVLSNAPKRPTHEIPFSSIGLNVGVSLFFNN